MEAELKEKVEQCLNCKVKPCTKGCPLENNIPAFIEKVKQDKLEEAYEILSETTVLPAICGRICPHYKQCMGKCVRGIKGQPVNIGDIEKYIGDMSIKNNYKLPNCEQERNEKIAIIGSGPAGLTCAAFLRRNGFKVTIYEKYSQLGGILRNGIPNFRLDKSILDNTIQKIGLKNENILKLEIVDEKGNSTGEFLEFDLEDIELPFKYQEIIERLKKSRQNLKNQFTIIEKKQDHKGKKLMSSNEEEKLKALNNFYKEQVEIYNIFLGENGVQKLLNGRKLRWTTLTEIDELIEKQIAPQLNVTMDDITKKIKSKYSNKKVDNVLE